MLITIMKITNNAGWANKRNASQLTPDMLVLSITNIVVQLQLVNIRQYNMVLNSPRFTTTVLAYYLFMQSSVLGCQASYHLSLLLLSWESREKDSHCNVMSCFWIQSFLETLPSRKYALNIACENRHGSETFVKYKPQSHHHIARLSWQWSEGSEN